VILNHCLYEQIQGLGNLQAVNNPATPLLGLPPSSRTKNGSGSRRPSLRD
jgi:hypothetical protein